MNNFADVAGRDRYWDSQRRSGDFNPQSRSMHVENELQLYEGG
ncbi:hypothetical protein [Paenibacillus elgii]